MIANELTDRRHRQPLLSGAVGIVIVPDPEAQRASRALAEELLGSAAEFVLGSQDLPHLTLYHAKVSDAPVEEVRGMSRTIQAQLVGASFTLRALGFAGGNFLFWDVDWISDTNQLLRRSHIQALALSRYLDKSVPAKATSEEGLQLTADELKNINKYGHPWVDSLYRPHITLGFGKGLETVVNLSRTEKIVSFTVADVCVARIGFPGRVEELLK